MTPPVSVQKPARNTRAAAALKAFHEEERYGKAYDLRLIRKVWQFVAPHQNLLWISLGVIVFTAGGALVRPLIMRSAIDDGAVAGNPQRLLRGGLLLAGVLVAEQVLGFLQMYAMQVAGARAMPMSSSVLVNKAELLDLIEQAREALPQQLTQADALLADVDAAKEQARADAAEIVAQARQEADRLVESEAVTVAARQKAAQILADAQEQADALRRDADDYCDRRLADFEIDLGKVLAQVQAGRAKLAGRLGFDGA